MKASQKGTSIGLTDGKGEEIFIGDLLVKINGSMSVVYEVNKYGNLFNKTIGSKRISDPTEWRHLTEKEEKDYREGLKAAKEKAVAEESRSEDTPESKAVSVTPEPVKEEAVKVLVKDASSLSFDALWAELIKRFPALSDEDLTDLAMNFSSKILTEVLYRKNLDASDVINESQIRALVDIIRNSLPASLDSCTKLLQPLLDIFPEPLESAGITQLCDELSRRNYHGTITRKEEIEF